MHITKKIKRKKNVEPITQIKNKKNDTGAAKTEKIKSKPNKKGIRQN